MKHFDKSWKHEPLYNIAVDTLRHAGIEKNLCLNTTALLPRFHIKSTQKSQTPFVALTPTITTNYYHIKKNNNNNG